MDAGELQQAVELVQANPDRYRWYLDNVDDDPDYDRVVCMVCEFRVIAIEEITEHDSTVHPGG